MKLNISTNDFYNFALSEIYDLLSEKDIYDKELSLLQAYNNSMLIMNDKADKVFQALKKDIYKTSSFQNEKNKVKIGSKDTRRYYNISKRLGLKMPVELEKKYSKK